MRIPLSAVQLFLTMWRDQDPAFTLGGCLDDNECELLREIERELVRTGSLFDPRIRLRLSVHDTYSAQLARRRRSSWKMDSPLQTPDDAIVALWEARRVWLAAHLADDNRVDTDL